MASFPSTPLLDDFQRRDSHTLGNRYAVVSGYYSLAILGRAAAATAGVLAFNVWRIKYRVNQQVWVQIKDGDNVERVWLAVRLNSVTPTDGYLCVIAPGTPYWQGTLYRWGGTTPLYAPLSLGVSALASGDLLGLDAHDRQLTLWYGAAPGAAAAVGTWTDAGLLERGYIGIGAQAKLS